MTLVRQSFPVIYACDNNFVPLLAASIKSLEINSPGSVKLIYIIDDGISPGNRQKLILSVSSGDIQLKFIPHSEVIRHRLKIPYFGNPQLPVTVFFRLFIEEFLPEDTEKALYLDCDTIVLHDIATLWQIDMTDHIIAAVQDLSIKRFDCDWGGIRNYRELGFAGETPYFNSGLLLFNFRKWVEYRSLEKTLEVARQFKKHILYGDQYCLNVVFADKWLKLDPLWNHMADYYLIDSTYHPEPFLLHFTGCKPIDSNYYYSEDYKATFFRYLDMTPWKGLKPRGGIQRKLVSMKRVLRKSWNQLIRQL